MGLEWKAKYSEFPFSRNLTWSENGIGINSSHFSFSLSLFLVFVSGRRKFSKNLRVVNFDNDRDTFLIAESWGLRKRRKNALTLFFSFLENLFFIFLFRFNPLLNYPLIIAFLSFSWKWESSFYEDICSMNVFEPF